MPSAAIRAIDHLLLRVLTRCIALSQHLRQHPSEAGEDDCAKELGYDGPGFLSVCGGCDISEPHCCQCRHPVVVRMDVRGVPAKLFSHCERKHTATRRNGLGGWLSFHASESGCRPAARSCSCLAAFPPPQTLPEIHTPPPPPPPGFRFTWS